MVTHKDIAKVVGVSQATVCKVLSNKNNNIGISRKTRMAVIQAAKTLGYNKDKVASSMIQLVDQTIAVLVEHLSNPFTSVTISGIEEEMIGTDFKFLFASSTGIAEQSLKTIESLTRRYTTGFILMPFYESNTNQQVSQYLMNRGIPFVQTHYYSLPSINNTPLICSNNYAIFKQLTEHLLSLGHERIAVIYTSPEYSIVDERLRGYRAALEGAGRKVDSALLAELPRLKYFDANLKRQLIKKWMARRQPPTAIMSIKDDCAMQVVRILQDMGLRVPDDMAVTGFDDYRYFIPKFYPDTYFNLTTVRQNLPEIGRQAVHRLIQEIETPKSKDLPLVVEVPCELIIRGSCGARLAECDRPSTGVDLTGLDGAQFMH